MDRRSDLQMKIEARRRLTSTSLVAGAGFEPVTSGYEVKRQQTRSRVGNSDQLIAKVIATCQLVRR